MAEAMSEVEQDPLNQQKTDEEKKSDSPSPKRSRSPHRKDQALVGGSTAGGLPGNDQDQKVEEPPKPEQQDSAMEAEAKTIGRHLMDTLTSASKSLLECSEKLEKNVVLLEECRADSSSIQSLAAGVNYYASTTKASQAAATANHKQLAWDWLSDPREKQPLKETLKSVCYISVRMHYQTCISGGRSQPGNIVRIEITQGDHDRADQVAEAYSW